MTWVSATLGELASRAGGEIRTGPFGSQLHKSDYVDDPDATPVVMPRDVVDGRVDTSSIARIDDATRDRLSHHILRPGDIVLARRGDIGRRAWIGETEKGWLCGTGSMRVSVTGSSELDPRFLYYYLGTQSAVAWLEGHAVGATMSNLSAGVVEQLPVHYPAFEDQSRIVRILDSMDALIENNRQRIEILEEMARLTYREWFVHFRFPAREDVELVDSDLGLVPMGWDVVDLGHLAEVVKGLSYKGTHLQDEGVPMANLKCFKPGGGFRRDGLKAYDGPYKEQHAVAPGDVIVANTDLTQAGNVIGSVARIPESLFTDGGLLTHHLFRVRSNDRRLASWYLLAALDDPRFREYARACASGTTVLGFRRDDVLRYPMLLPPSGLIESFESFVAPQKQLAEVLEDQNAVLARTRDLLLPRLVSGELDVSELDLDAVSAA